VLAIKDKGAVVNFQEFMSVLRTRWLTVCVTAVATLLVVITATLLTTPLYEASTRLFVSTSAGTSLSDAYQGGRFSQDRVLSYSELLTGDTLAQRTVDKLGLDMSASELAKKVKASAKPDTVLVDVNVTDASPVRARDIANALSDEFVLMVRQLETPEDGSRPDARVVVEQRASMPDAPVTPNKKRNIALGAILGLVLGVGLAVLRDWLDNTVKNRETLQDITHVGLVGSIPLDKQLRKDHAISFEGDNSTVAESFRKLRTNLQFLAVDNPPRLIVVASSLPGEGKSTTAINLALVLAEAGHNVVVVDGDMRRPKMDEYLGVVGSVGFSTVLSGAATLDEALQATNFARLTVLASGAIPPNPSELLGSARMTHIIAEFNRAFDVVIFDSPPLLPVTDAAVLAKNVGGAIIIVAAGRTHKNQLKGAIAALTTVGAPVSGLVLTMLPTKGPDAYGYGNYGYGYGYGSDLEAETATTKGSRRTRVKA